MRGICSATRDTTCLCLSRMAIFGIGDTVQHGYKQSRPYTSTLDGGNDCRMSMLNVGRFYGKIVNVKSAKASKGFQAATRDWSAATAVNFATNAFTFGVPSPVTSSYPGPALRAPLLPEVISRKQGDPRRG